jgi:glycosyltransferase involved in cell wall biosynthesis
MSATSAPLHVAQISFFVDPAGRPPTQLLSAWPSLVDIAECATQGGVRVSVLQASELEGVVERSGITYHFLSFGECATRADQSARLATVLQGLAPDVHHVHGLGFPLEVSTLAQLAPQAPILLQDHADRVPRLWRRAPGRRAAAAVSGVTFCARAQARPFLAAGLIDRHTSIYEIPESTSRFTPADQAQAQRLTATAGRPLVLWVGHLNANKDPLTVLAGVSRAAQSLPELQLWCCFASAPLLQEVQRAIRGDRRLRDRVHLLGRVSHERIEQLMRAADLFVLGSHHEGSGYSLIEALACGVTPVVTDIPSFRVLTGEGTLGRLWRCGDARGLSEALQECAAAVGAAARARVRAHFEAQISYAAVGARFAAAYRELHARGPRARRARGPAPL